MSRKFSKQFYVSKTFINANVTEKRNKKSRDQHERPFSSFVYWIDVKWSHAYDAVRAASKVTWHLLQKHSPSLQLGYKSLVGEQSVVLALYAGAKTAHVSQI